VKFGRKTKLTAEQIAHARQQIDSEAHSLKDMAVLLKVDRTTLWRALKG
jgi:hypothetical protein